MPKPSSARPSGTSQPTHRSHGDSSAPLFLETQAPLTPEESAALAASAPAVTAAPSPTVSATDEARGESAKAAHKYLATRKSASEPSQEPREKVRAAARPKGASGGPWELAVPALFVGTVLVSGLLHPDAPAPHQPHVAREVQPVRILPTVSPSQTWVVKSQSAFSFVSLQGRLQRGEVIEGHVALGGQVSRVMVREGQRVDVGDRVLTISSSQQRALPMSNGRQSQAESEQVQAVRRKEALESRIARAHTDYAEAQARLDATNKRLAEARALLKKVSAGEQVLDPTAPQPEPRKRKRAASARTNSVGQAEAVKLESAQSEHRATLAASASAEEAARAASKRAKSLANAWVTAQSKERAAKSALENAQAEKAKAPAQAADAAPKIDAPNEAEAKVTQAESALADAQKKTQTAQEEARDAQAEADKARTKASQATERARQSVLNLQTAQAQAAQAPGTQSEAQENTPAPQPKATLSPSAAVRLVREAMSEASSAASNAERLKARVESFKGTATDISSDIQDSARNIEQAQQQVLDNTIESSLSTLRAPASGTVLSVVAEGEQVSEGQTVVRVAQGSQGLEATLEDRSQAWKQLRPSMTLPGRLLSNPLVGADAQASGLSAGGTLTLGASPLRQGAPVTLQVREVEAPQEAGGPARIRVAVTPGSSPMVQPRSNMAVAVALPKGKDALLSIPTVAIARGAGSQPQVAVLHEVAAPVPAAAKTPSVPKVAATEEESPALDAPKAPPQLLEKALAKPTPPALQERLFEIEWRSVALSDALPEAMESDLASGQKMKKVLSGLQPGERILRDASQWQGRFASTPGKPTRVRLLVSRS